MMKFFQSMFVFLLIMFNFPAFAMDDLEITPYKYVNRPALGYDIPPSSRFTVKREEKDAPKIVYYLSKSQAKPYAIAILCGGSSMKGELSSVIHFHRYFLEEFQKLGLGVLTLEQWGIDGNTINDDEFLRHYTRTQRLKDHQTVINHLMSQPPEGWNGKLVFLGVSEGGPLVTDLTILYPETTRATINWVGAGDWTWQEELWAFLQALLKEDAECKDHQTKLSKCNICFEDALSRQDYDARVEAIQRNPTSDKDFFGMSYMYHADAFQKPPYDYKKIHTPFLVVAGALDSHVQSSDSFVKKALEAGAPVTYERVEDMGHGIREKPKVINNSFEWLREKLS